MKKRLIPLLVFLLFFAPPLANDAYAGILGKGDATGTPGEWYIGDEPLSTRSGSLPIVFVHGLNSSSNTWIDENDMDEITYNKNYQTAFIDLYPTKNMWDNGQLLSTKLSEMYTYFGKKMILVTHSKGGIDAQSALVHSNAHQYVDKIFTLSTPHHGSQLADLAYSSWAGWLSAIIGTKNDATYSLQTGYMSYFRSITDSNSKTMLTPYYTFGGTDWGSFGGSLYWGGLYLRQYGANDGAVTVKSSRLPYGNEIRVGEWDHGTIKNGNATFNLFEPYLTQSVPAFTSHRSFNGTNEETETGNVLVRGGEFTGTKVETFEVEEGAKSIAFDWMSQNKDSDVIIESPEGKRFTTLKATKDSGIFQGAYHHQVKVDSPRSGKWKAIVKQRKKESYLMQVSYDSELNDGITVDEQKSSEVKLVVDSSAIETESLKGDIVIQYSKNGKVKQKKISSKKFHALESFPIKKAGEGIYHIMIDVEGDTKKGKQFERTILYTIYVDKHGKVYRP
ncbi:esterase/lipase family protein [Alkalihalobacillus sp. CinArs1]|uniref:esterase/lipase family protein n=1 Tax=Alkalihalobacillus sp. CinArs1 TaxID=2995314 RepID=UPI0022DE2CEF|nr:hypothetical protein [Alkalihalobacillus sp. CinArs1]